MSPAIEKPNKILNIVRLRHMLKQWRQKSANRAPSDVPAGHVAIYVGSECRRFVVRATHLNHPVFKNLLVQAEEEFGFTNRKRLVIPCDESVFEDAVRFVSRSDTVRVNRSEYKRCFHEAESRSLLCDSSVF